MICSLSYQDLISDEIWLDYISAHTTIYTTTQAKISAKSIRLYANSI